MIHEERKGISSKAAKFSPRAQKGILCGYDGSTIYRVFIEKDYKVIRVKDLRIHEDAIFKDGTDLPTYDSIMIQNEKDTTLEISLTPSKNQPELNSKISEIPKRGRGRPRKHAHVAQVLSLLSNEALSEPEHIPTLADRGEEDPLILLAKELEIEGAAYLNDYDAFIQSDIAEPQTYHQAMNSKYANEWSLAMDEEIKSLLENNTWDTSPTESLEPGHIVPSGKWVFKLKRDVNGKIVRFKARWVVKGYLQQYGVDFDQTFASVVKPMAFRLLFALAAHHDLDIEQLDRVTAFLNGLIDQLIYVHMPKGYDTAGMVCRLNKALYGLEQSPRLWYERLSAFLLSKLGLEKLHADHSIFVTPQGIKGPIDTSFVDDLNIIGPKGSPMITEVKKQLKLPFKMVDMGPISYYLGLKVERDRVNKTIKLSQPAYIEKYWKDSICKPQRKQTLPCEKAVSSSMNLRPPTRT